MSDWNKNYRGRPPVKSDRTSVGTLFGLSFLLAAAFLLIEAWVLMIMLNGMHYYGFAAVPAAGYVGCLDLLVAVWVLGTAWRGAFSINLKTSA